MPCRTHYCACFLSGHFELRSICPAYQVRSMLFFFCASCLVSAELRRCSCITHAHPCRTELAVVPHHKFPLGLYLQAIRVILPVLFWSCWTPSRTQASWITTWMCRWTSARCSSCALPMCWTPFLAPSGIEWRYGFKLVYCDYQLQTAEYITRF